MKSVLLSVGALCMIAVTAIFMQEDVRQNQLFVEEMEHEREKEQQEAKGYSEYMRSLRVDAVTGKVNVQAILQSRKQANLMAQSSSKTAAIGNLEWIEGGPDNIGGRTRAFFADNDGTTLYMGNVSGGFWSSTDDGNNWTQLAGNDSSTALSIGCITKASNGDIYYGTGEGFTGRAFAAYSEMPSVLGEGVFKSTDGGATFTQLPATRPANLNSPTAPWAHVNSISAHPTNANEIICATNSGIQRTTDGGVTWSKPGGLNFNFRFLDVEYSQQGNVVVAASNNGIYISTDGGATFGLNQNSTNNNLPGATAIGRIELAIAPSDENYIYAIMSTGGQTEGCYKSTDKGATWTQIGNGGSAIWDPLGTQGDYNIAFAIHPTNPEIVFLGGQLELYRYVNSTWELIAFANQAAFTGRYVHADMHGIYFNKTNPNKMYVVTDGGFFRTEDCLVEDPFFEEKNKDYSTAQCYSVAANRLGDILFGTQDNGTNRMTNTISNSSTTSTPQFGGDGMDCALSDYNTNYSFGCSQYGVLRRSSDGGNSYSGFFDDNIDAIPTASGGDGEPDEGSNWVAPVLLKELNDSSNVFMIGLNDYVWFTQDATKTTGSAVWFPLTTAAQIGGGYSAVAMSDDGTVAYVGKSNGVVYRITGIDMFGTKYIYDNDQTRLLSDGFSMQSSFVVDQIGNFGRHITDLECDASGNTLLVTLPNYNNTNHIRRSMNAKTAAVPSFANIQGNLPDMPVYSAAYLAPNEYLVGTDLGIWGTDNGGVTWFEANNIGSDPTKWHPRLATMEIVVKDTREGINGSDMYVGNIIYTGTHGRGTFYTTSYNTQVWPTSTTNVNGVNSTLDIYPNPVINKANVRLTSNENTKTTVRVLSLNGKLVKDQYENVVKGTNNIELDMSGLSSGVYIVSMNIGGKVSTSKIIKR